MLGVLRPGVERTAGRPTLTGRAASADPSFGGIGRGVWRPREPRTTSRNAPAVAGAGLALSGAARASTSRVSVGLDELRHRDGEHRGPLRVPERGRIATPQAAAKDEAGGMRRLSLDSRARSFGWKPASAGGRREAARAAASPGGKLMNGSAAEVGQAASRCAGRGRWFARRARRTSSSVDERYRAVRPRLWMRARSHRQEGGPSSLAEGAASSASSSLDCSRTVSSTDGLELVEGREPAATGRPRTHRVQSRRRSGARLHPGARVVRGLRPGAASSSGEAARRAPRRPSSSPAWVHREKTRRVRALNERQADLGLEPCGSAATTARPERRCSAPRPPRVKWRSSGRAAEA